MYFYGCLPYCSMNYIHWGLGIRTVIIPRPPFRDSLKGHILSGQFDPKGLGIRTCPDTGEYSESRYTDKKGKWFKGQLLSGQFNSKGLGIRTPVRIPRPRVGNLIQRFLIYSTFAYFLNFWYTLKKFKIFEHLQLLGADMAIILLKITKIRLPYCTENPTSMQIAAFFKTSPSFFY